MRDGTLSSARSLADQGHILRWMGFFPKSTCALSKHFNRLTSLSSKHVNRIARGLEKPIARLPTKTSPPPFLSPCQRQHFSMTSSSKPRRNGAEAAADYDPEIMANMPGGFINKWVGLSSSFHVAFRSWLGRSLQQQATAPPGVKSIPIVDGPANVLVHLPPVRAVEGGPGPAVLHIHGGGTLTGSPEMFAPAAGGYAAALGVPVVAARYRLSPGARFPAALEDCLAAWDWMLANAAKYDIDPNRVAFVGDSAGALLVASVCMKLKDEGKPLPAAVLLNYGMFDDRTSAREDMKNARHPYWSNASNIYGWTSYLGQAPGSPTTPKYAVPGRAPPEDFRGFPPAWVGVGAADIFHDEDVEFAEKLKSVGVDVELVVVPRAFHLFDTAAHPAAKEYNKSKFGYLSKKLAIPRIQKKAPSKL